MKWLRVYSKVLPTLRIEFITSCSKRLYQRFKLFHQQAPDFKSKLLKVRYKIVKKYLGDNANNTQVIKQRFSVDSHMERLQQFIKTIKPTEWQNSENDPLKGIYLRLDFWAKIKAGGSYGHTCYVVKELANKCQLFVAFMANRYDLIDHFNINQIELGGFNECLEPLIVSANNYYYQSMKSALRVVKPNFIYERICIGNYVGARLARELKIPYIVEYNGSEIAMKRSFCDSDGYEFESFYLQAEDAAFRQATVISVISEIFAN